MSEEFQVAFPSMTSGGRAIQLSTSFQKIHAVPANDEGSFDEVSLYAGHNAGTQQWVEIIVGRNTSDPAFRCKTGFGLETVMLGHRMRPGECIFAKAESANIMVLVEINRAIAS